MLLWPGFINKKYAVDLPSVCNQKNNDKGQPMLEVFDKANNYLKSHGVPESHIVTFSDASFKYCIDDSEKYFNYIEIGLIIEMPAGIKADKGILAYCLEHEDAVFISNDLMREYYSFLPYDKWIVERRICLILVQEEVFLIPMLEEIPEKPFQDSFDTNKKRTTLDILDEIENSNDDSEWSFFPD